MEKKIIVVVGATGAQGGGLVRAILDDPESRFSARALTRDTNSEKARSLAALGADVVSADVDDVESLKQAFRGAYGAFCVSFFWEHFSPVQESAQAKAMAEAAKAEGLQHVIWSTLEDTRQWVPLDDPRMPTLQENYKVPHFDAKGEANHFFSDLDLPVTFLLTSFYWDNLINFGMAPTQNDDGTYGFVLPMDDKRLPGIAAEDIGRCAFGIFQAGREYIGQTIGIAGEHLTGDEMANNLGRNLQKDVVYNYVPPEIYRTFGFPGADDIANMFQFNRDFETVFCDARDTAVSRQLNPRLQTFAQWLEQNGERIPLG